MNARTIAKCRKKIQSESYIEKRMYELAVRCKRWNDFYLFDCDKFYVGEEMAYLNKAKYQKYGMRDKGKFEWYKKGIGGTNMKKIIQIDELEYNKLYRVASLNEEQIHSEAKKMWEDGPAHIEIHVRANSDENDYFSMKTRAYLYSPHSKFPISYELRKRFEKIIQNQVADSIESRFSHVIKTRNEYTERLRYLDLLKRVLYLIAFTGWAAFVLLFAIVR